jgi:hypothetical protein
MAFQGTTPDPTQQDRQLIAQFQQQALGLIMSGNLLGFVQAAQALAAQLSPAGQQQFAAMVQPQVAGATGGWPVPQRPPTVHRDGDTYYADQVVVGRDRVTLLR